MVNPLISAYNNIIVTLLDNGKEGRGILGSMHHDQFKSLDITLILVECKYIVVPCDLLNIYVLYGCCFF